ncbi:MAG: thioesterase family protein, partial [Actinomycetia bacterium]|nr:thioesterase family protein [Actinomycetes bacterium]
MPTASQMGRNVTAEHLTNPHPAPTTLVPLGSLVARDSRLAPGGQAMVDELVALLDLETIEQDIYRGGSPKVALQRVFGGQVAGQALVAAGRTVPADRAVHSLHAYFIRPGDPAVPLVYMV